MIIILEYGWLIINPPDTEIMQRDFISLESRASE